MEQLCINIFGSVHSVVESRLGQPLTNFCTLPGFRGEALGKLFTCFVQSFFAVHSTASKALLT